MGPYLRAVMAHPLVVGFIMLVVLGGSAAWLSHRSNSYQTTADILFTATSSDNGVSDGLAVLRESGEPTRLAQTAATLLDSPQAAVLAARSLGAGFTPSGVRQVVGVQPLGQSNIIAVTATAKSAALAQRLANAFANGSLQARQALLRAQAEAQGAAGAPKILSSETIAQERQALLGALLKGQDPNFSLSQAASLPSAPTNTSKWLILALSLLAGFALGSGTAIAMEMLSDRIRSSDELLGIYGLPVLAYIPPLPRRRGNERRGPAPTPPPVREAYQMIRVQLDTRTSAAESHEGRTILLTSGSSGDGKTSSALSLAGALAEAGHRVILMDLDLRKPDLGRLLHLERAAGVMAVVQSDIRLTDVMVTDEHMPLLSFVPAGRDPNENLLNFALNRLPELIVQAREMADYVVIDTPPLGEVSDAYQLLPLVDEVIVVARPGNTRRASFEFMRELLNRARRTPLGIVIVGETAYGTSYSYYGQPQVEEPRMRAWLGRSAGS